MKKFNDPIERLIDKFRANNYALVGSVVGGAALIGGTLLLRWAFS